MQELFKHLPGNGMHSFFESDHIRLLEPCGPFWDTHALTVVSPLPSSRFAAVQEQLKSRIAGVMAGSRLKSGLVFRTVPAIVEKARFERGHLFCKDKLVLNGQSGARYISRFIVNGPRQAGFRKADLTEAADAMRTAATRDDFPLYEGSLGGLDFAIEVKTFHNFYHFVTESFGALCVAAALPLSGKVVFHAARADPPPDYIRNWINALFPELAERVVFAGGGKYDRVITALSMRFPAILTPGGLDKSIRNLFFPSTRWDGRALNRDMLNCISFNGVEEFNLMLRERALQRAEEIPVGRFPSRIWMDRDVSAGARKRSERGVKPLVNQLMQEGFEKLAFERLNPLEQVRAAFDADCVVGVHGAGFTNMMFAKPTGHFVEIGTLQIARKRWGDFFCCSNTSHTSYSTVFCDHDTDTPEQMPQMKKDGLVGPALNHAQRTKLLGVALGGAEEDSLVLSPDLVSWRLWTLARDQKYKEVADLARARRDVVDLDERLLGFYGAACAELGSFEEARTAFEQAWTAYGTRRINLQRLIWLSRRLGRDDEIPALIEAHHKRFPEYHQSFMENFSPTSVPS